MFKFLWKKIGLPVQDDAVKPAVRPMAAEGQTVSGTQLHYDPDLVSNLLADHQMLLGIFGDIAAAMKLKNMKLVKEKLGKFGDELNGHLLKENIRFYVYLQHSLNNDPENAATMLGFRKEMQQIGKAVVDFLHRYTTEGDWNEATWQSFQQEIGGIGQVLTKRIQREENSLYPLYLPPKN
ncbi:MAG: hemerythrin domain-containing protein [Sideroxyarcus sp.]|nr:hemerythrin domain-containing protein [Sideroxyarcus sp.]